MWSILEYVYSLWLWSQFEEWAWTAVEISLKLHEWPAKSVLGTMYITWEAWLEKQQIEIDETKRKPTANKNWKAESYEESEDEFLTKMSRDSKIDLLGSSFQRFQ